jgi:hypothetical protein
MQGLLGRIWSLSGFSICGGNCDVTSRVINFTMPIVIRPEHLDRFLELGHAAFGPPDVEPFLLRATSGLVLTA